ncbi:hypothetical protein VKT23_018178 [Stygiomarasmius scandens]|uniref:Uncharacterized protein n=1 Tax=Marasmiellus scandens TaxID=2682957 RepID=A0ABR1IQ40_9AGAR
MFNKIHSVLGLVLLIAAASVTAGTIKPDPIPCGDAAPGTICPKYFYCCDAPTFFGDGRCLPDGEVCPF